ncbi:SitI3 family protein [Streptomyces sp. NPDC048417]|uniref:SitI3 family protein n=1 Tax=Streptomyces sp. NPDC048417 TaxID=3155387 RepID=UPI00341ED9E7
MAIDFDLDVATGSSPVEVATWLAEIGRDIGVFDASFTAERLLDKEVFLYTSRGLWVRVLESDRLSPWDPVVTELGFTPTVSVAFRMGKGADVGLQQTDMVGLVARLLERVEGDAVLHFQHEVIWLLRRNGELSLDERDDIWSLQRLALMTRPFRRETHRMDSE